MPCHGTLSTHTLPTVRHILDVNLMLEQSLERASGVKSLCHGCVRNASGLRQGRASR